MTSTTILTVLLVFGFLIGRFLRRFETPHFVFSGMIYLLVGLLIGSYLGFGILTEELLYKLEPLTDLMTGIAGFLLGLRVRVLLANKRCFIGGTVSGLITFFLTALLFFMFSPFPIGFEPGTLNLMGVGEALEKLGANSSFIDFFGNINRQQFWFSLGVGATACSASLLSLGMISKFNQTQTEITRALSILAPAGQMIAVFLLGLCLSLARADVSASSLNISLMQWVLATVTSGLICGLLFSLFIGKQSNENRIMLAALGAIIFASGIGALLSVSSMFVCFITGATISLFSSYAEFLKENLVRVEEPIFVLLLVIGGATWQPHLDRVWLLPLLYFTIRAFSFTWFYEAIHQKLTKRKLPRLGQGLFGQDLIAVAIALSLSKEFPNLAQLFLTTILGGIFLNDFVANPLLKKVILDNEQMIEVQPIVEEGST